MTNGDGTSRIVYAGPDYDCAVAGLGAGKTFMFQVRALNKAGVCKLVCNYQRMLGSVYLLLLIK